MIEDVVERLVQRVVCIGLYVSKGLGGRDARCYVTGGRPVDGQAATLSSLNRNSSRESSRSGRVGSSRRWSPDH